MKVELAAEAREQIRRIDSWWRENRTAAPDLFTDELDRALLSLEASPTLGVDYPAYPGIRRLLLIGTGHHVYTRAEPDRVFVVAVWSAYRGRGPRL